MKNRQILLWLSVIILCLSASFVLINTFAKADSLSSKVPEASGFIDEVEISSSPDQLPLRFPIGDWPWYAEEVISLDPVSPLPGTPSEICAVVVNDDTQNDHTGVLRFGVAPMGIGVPHTPIGTVDILVLPGNQTKGCITWVLPEPGRWSIEALLFQEEGTEPLQSLRNIDFWEPLIPGESHDLVFSIGPLGVEGTATFELITHLSGWEFAVIPSQIAINDPYKVYTATLRTTPPQGFLFGTTLPIVDLEGFLNDQPIGGFRKVDSPTVPLHYQSISPPGR
jgi:hypothetical protein